MSERELYRELNIGSFTRDFQRIDPYQILGNGIALGFPRDSQMKVFARATDHCVSPSIEIYSDQRVLGEYLSLEIDISEQAKAVQLKMRYAPALRVFPNVYAKNFKQEQSIPLLDMNIPDEVFELEIPLGEAVSKINFKSKELRANIFFPDWHWFRLSLFDVKEFR